MIGSASYHFMANNNQPYDDWLGDTFALIKVTETLVDSVHKANFSSPDFVRNTLRELNWLHEEVTKIHASVESRLRHYSSHSHILAFESTMSQIYELISSIRHSFGNATIDAVRKSSNLLIARANLESWLVSFSLALGDLYKIFQKMLGGK